MERPFSTSRVIVEYFDPHDVYKLVAPGLLPRLPLRDLHWRSPSRPLRSIHTLHVELVPSGTDIAAFLSSTPASSPNTQAPGPAGRDDGFQTAPVGGQPQQGSSAESPDVATTLRPSALGRERRHQIPGLRRTPYLKVLLVRCDDNDTYKSHTRAEVREWVKTQTAGAKKSGSVDNHDASEWLVVHVVLPNTAAASQPRVTGGGSGGGSGGGGGGSSSEAGADGGTTTTTTSRTVSVTSTSRWRGVGVVGVGGSGSTLLEKLRGDFNGTGKGAVDRVAQVRIGINDVPYDALPRVVPAVPSGYQETAAEAEGAWVDLMGKVKSLILASFDARVRRYEDDVREKDAQRALPGWNFCTFFILKEGLARGFESVGLVEDALVGYDELTVGLDSVVHEQAVATGAAEAHGGALLAYTDELKARSQAAAAQMAAGAGEVDDEEAVDLGAEAAGSREYSYSSSTPISATRKPYRELILANNVSVLDFRCYIFARQMSLLLRMGNAGAGEAAPGETAEPMLHGVAPRPLPPRKPVDESENLSKLAEICRRALEFIPAVSQIMRRDIMAGLGARSEDSDKKEDGNEEDETETRDLPPSPVMSETVDNIVASFAFSVAQQILAQTATKALPIPPSALAPSDEPKSAAIPEPKTMMHPARSSSLHTPRTTGGGGARASSPHIFAQGRRASVPEAADAGPSHFLKAGLEELAARRAELYTLCRNLLEECGKKRGWSDGWDSVPIVGSLGTDPVTDAMEEVSLEDGADAGQEQGQERELGLAWRRPGGPSSLAGIEDGQLRAALGSRDDFYRLYEALGDKALRHYTVANHAHSVQANMVDLGVLKFHQGDYAAAAAFFRRTTPFYGESGWSLLEMSMLVMYSRCLRKLRQRDDQVKVLLKLLSTAAAAEMERREGGGGRREKTYPEKSEISGFLADLLEVSAALGKELRAPLANFFSEVEVDGAPAYDDGRDSFTLGLTLRSVLVDEFEAQTVTVRLVSTGGGPDVDGGSAGGHKEIWLRASSPVALRPGKNTVRLRSFAAPSAAAGAYEVQQVTVATGKFTMQLEREKTSSLLRKPRVVLHRRASCLDVRLDAARETRLDRNGSLELRLATGWNDVASCEVRIKSATAGMRLMTSDAVILGDQHQPTRPPEGGLFSFGAVAAQSTVEIRLPFTTEQDLGAVSVRVEVTYTTSDESVFTFAKTASVPVALALGVNVQDVFKHAALFSRFTVSTATASPLRLLGSELQDSDLFKAQGAGASTEPVVIFSKQPASLLYRITRKGGAAAAGGKTNAKKTMYLKLHYAVLLDELEDRVRATLASSLRAAGLWELSPLAASTVASQLRRALSAYDLERAALLGELPTAFLSGVPWTRYFAGLADDVISSLADAVAAWQKQHPVIEVFGDEQDQLTATTTPPRTIIIPVDIPSIRVVHTADMRIHQQEDLLPDAVCANQLLPVTLHLKWTRAWDTGDASSSLQPSTSQDLEFSYEVTAPTDTWLLGGRRKGHFVIPAATAAGDDDGLSSMPSTEADIPLVLSPLREGWLPYPHVEIREIAKGDSGSAAAYGHRPCETDHRNLGETVRVVGDRRAITLSLDASGPGGAPLVLETERMGLGRVVA